MKRLVPLDPRWSETKPFRNKFGKVVYSIHGSGRDRKILPQADVFHVAGLGWGRPDRILPRRHVPPGDRPRARGRGVRREFLRQRDQRLGRASKIKKRLNPDGRKNLRESIEEVHGSPYRANRLMILEEDTEYQQTSINPDDAQFLETRAFQVLEVCRIYRVPPNKVMDLSQSHLANLEQSNTDYVTTSLQPWLVKWEQQADRKLLTASQRAAGFCCRHDLSALLRGDSAARGTLYKTMLECGAISPNQIAERENLPPVEGGDVRILPLNMTTVAAMAKAAEAPVEPPSADRVEDKPDLPARSGRRRPGCSIPFEAANGETNGHAAL